MLTSEYPPNIYGGVGRHVQYLVENLKKYIDVEVRAVGNNPSSEGVKFYSPWEIFDGTYPWDKALETISLNARIVREEIDADIIHAHTWYMDFAGFLAKKLYGKKLVCTVHSLEPLRPWKRESLGRGYELSGWMEEFGLKNSDGIIAVSGGMKEDIRRVYGIPENRIYVVHNGIDLEKYGRNEDPEYLRGLGVEEGYVLFVGRLSRQKGIDVLLDAADRINGKVLLITGKEDTKEYLREISEKVRRKKNVIWIHRFFTEEEIVKIYSHASVFVCPSIYEPFGIINLEAMACEVPVVASDVGGIREIVVDGKTGFLIPPGDADALADKVNILLEDDNLRRSMGIEGRKRAMEFSWENIAKKTVEVYRRVLGEV